MNMKPHNSSVSVHTYFSYIFLPIANNHIFCMQLKTQASKISRLLSNNKAADQQ